MPELPEVEVLVRHLAARIRGRKIGDVQVRRARVVRPTKPSQLQRILPGMKFLAVVRRGKYLLFTLGRAGSRQRLTLVGHLGMTGRMYVVPAAVPLPKHTAVVLGLGRENFIFEDTRYFGRLTLDTSPVRLLGPEPLGSGFTIQYLTHRLKRSAQPVKVKLLDQRVVAGMGNIYASEALFRARISPRTAACRLGPRRIDRLWRAIRETLTEAIDRGSTVPLNYSGRARRDGFFYFGRVPEARRFYEERLRVYDREGKPCWNCGTPIRRLVQAARSTFFCPRCQA